MTKNLRNVAKKALCLTLSASMLAGSPGVSVLAEETVKAEATTSAVPLTCETGSLNLVDNGRSIVLHLWLNQEDALIQQRIYREDVVLGGAFQNMIVSEIKNDEKIILLDLVGVPVLSGETQGTMEFPGFLFGSDGNVQASVEVIAKEGTEEEMKPSFYPVFEGMRDNGDTVDLSIELVPQVGSFAEGFGEENIRLARDFKGATLTTVKDAGDGSYEAVVSVPKESFTATDGPAAIEEMAARAEEDGFSCYGAIILSEGSMVSPGGKTYGNKLYAEREYSSEMTGRNLSQNDVQTIKTIMGAFGTSTFNSISAVVKGGATAASAAYTLLGFLGVVPTAGSRHAEIMESLGGIQYTVNEISNQCQYITNQLDEHSRMLKDIGRKLDEQYLADFDKEFNAMVEAMNLLEIGLKDKDVQRQIVDVVERLSEKYQVPQGGIGRDFDEGADLFTSGSEYEQVDYDLATDGFWEDPQENAYLEVIENDQMFSESGTDLFSSGETAGAEGEDLLFSGDEAGEAQFSSEDAEEELQDSSDKKDEETDIEDRILDEEETKKFFKELNSEISNIYISPQLTIGDQLKTIIYYYPRVIPYFKKNNSSNPIVAYCNAHAGSDNFATTSLMQKEAYKQRVIGQLNRALMILAALDSPSLYNGWIEEFKAIDWPDVQEGTKDANGNPYCYLMQGYVRLATPDEAANFWFPVTQDSKKSAYKPEVAVTSSAGVKVSAREFAVRMQGRTLAQELELAEIKNLHQLKDGGVLFETHNPDRDDPHGFAIYTVPAPQNHRRASGIAFGYERWASNYGKVVYKEPIELLGAGTVEPDSEGHYRVVTSEPIFWDGNTVSPDPVSNRVWDNHLREEYYETPLTYLKLVS